ncbi:ESX secretion-associated protein EspG [Nocardia aurantia]|uniref:ESX secretion-associated protein EspG n=1 Tax=Nocardia aurantia TaxID=2585199 RepID=UPI0018860D0A|nr:ESX secretion-associated protein EspG [Nocardia aurantia]
MNPRSSWNFTPDEFAWVWEAETGADAVPFPISILETPSTTAEYARYRAEVSVRYPRHGDPDLTGPLRALADPDLRIVSWGRFHHSDVRLRALGAASGDLGVVLSQKPGTAADSGGDLRLVVTRPGHLGGHLAATLPPVAAGAAGSMTAPTPRVRGEGPAGSWLRDDMAQRSVEERVRALLRAPRSAEGYLRIERGPREQLRPAAHLTWFDVELDTRAGGRYLVDVDDSETVVTAVSAEELAAQITRRAESGG